MAIAAMIGRHLATRAVLGIGKKIYQSHKKRKKKKEKFKAEKAAGRKKAEEFFKKNPRKNPLDQRRTLELKPGDKSKRRTLEIKPRAKKAKKRLL